MQVSSYERGATPVVVFDLDGVLIDSAEANVQAFKFGLEQVGISVNTPEAILSLVGLPALTMLHRLGCPETELDRVFRDYVQPHYLENIAILAKAYPGSKAVLEQLKEAGFRIGSCTSGDRKTQTEALKAIGLWDYIEEMQTPDDSRFGKPEPEYLQELLLKFGPHGEVHHVEDSEVGLCMGRDCGAFLYFASYGNGKLSGKVTPHQTLRSIKELPRNILKEAAGLLQ